MAERGKVRLWLWLAVLFVGMAVTSCSDDGGDGSAAEPQRTYTQAVRELQRICQENSEVRRLLEHAISQAATVNPDRNYNPAQTLDEFYRFVDRNVRCLPWDVMLHPGADDYGKSLWGRADQGVGYFWFVVDQPLDELRGRGYYYPTVEFVEPFASWLSTYSQSWGDWLSTEESWSDNCYQMVKYDPDWGLTKGWYGEGNQWKTFNEFFARRLVNPDRDRPVDEEAAVVFPADSWPQIPTKGEQLMWRINDQNRLEYPNDPDIKTALLDDIGQLVGGDSRYKDAFAGGVLTHTFLDVNCYHRYHSPVDGELVELRRVPGVSAGGGYTYWRDDLKRYKYVNNTGFQMVETRACAVIKTAQYGLVAMLPVGMSQISSVNWLPSLQVGQQLKRGQEMGFFQFGGSDVILLFQKGVQVVPAFTKADTKSDDPKLVGQAYAYLTK